MCCVDFIISSVIRLYDWILLHFEAIWVPFGTIFDEKGSEKTEITKATPGRLENKSHEVSTPHCLSFSTSAGMLTVGF